MSRLFCQQRFNNGVFASTGPQHENLHRYKPSRRRLWINVADRRRTVTDATFCPILPRDWYRPATGTAPRLVPARDQTLHRVSTLKRDRLLTDTIVNRTAYAEPYGEAKD